MNFWYDVGLKVSSIHLLFRVNILCFRVRVLNFCLVCTSIVIVLGYSFTHYSNGYDVGLDFQPIVWFLQL